MRGLDTNVLVRLITEDNPDAIAEYRRGRADFSDYLIGGENDRAGCSDTITPDGELAKVERFSLLPTL